MKLQSTYTLVSIVVLVQACGGAGQDGEQHGSPSPSTPAPRGQLHDVWGTEEVPYEVKDGLAVYGDIILGDADAVADEQRESQLAKVGKHPLGHRIDPNSAGGSQVRWPGPDIVINWTLDSTGIDVVKLRAEMRNWEEAFSGTSGTYSAYHPHFHECTFPCSLQECSMYSCPYLVRVVENAGQGCAGQSSVGRVPLGPATSSKYYQYLRIPRTIECSDASFTMRHELGHLLGLKHEHQRLERDSYVSVFAPYAANVPDYMISNNGGAVRADGRYNFQSVMHYGAQYVYWFEQGGWNIKLANGQPLPPIAGYLTSGDVAALDSTYVDGASDPTTALGGHGHPSSPAPGAAARDNKRAVAVRGWDETLIIREKVGATWSSWNSKGGIIHSSPAVAIKPNGSVVAVAIGGDSATPCYWDGAWSCYMGSNTSGYAFDTTSLPSDTSGTPSMWIGDDGGVHVVAAARSPTTLLRKLLRNDKPFGDSGWSGWYVASNAYVWGTPAITSANGATTQIFYADNSDDGIHSIGPDIGFPQGSRPPPGMAWGSGVSAVPRSGSYVLFVEGNDNRIWALQKNALSGVWFWKPYGGPNSTVPAAAGVASGGQIELFFGGPDYASQTDFPVVIDGVWYPFLNTAVWRKTLF